MDYKVRFNLNVGKNIIKEVHNKRNEKDAVNNIQEVDIREHRAV